MRKRTVALLCVALLLSIASTLAIAWACATWLSIDQDIPGRFTAVEVRDELWETFYVQKRFGHTRTNFIRGSDHYDASTDLFVSSNSPPDEIWQETSAGWPWRALRCERETFAVIVPDRFGYIRNTSPQIRNGIAAFGSALTWRDLPYEPVWPALIGNVLVHGAAWYAIIIGLFALRMVNRTRRGLCPQCAYDLRRDLSRGCPECGWRREPVVAASQLQKKGVR